MVHGRAETALEIAYDTLIVAAGATHSYFGHEEWADALVTVLEAMRPGERLAFVLHEFFAVPLGETLTLRGQSVHVTEESVSRARERLSHRLHRSRLQSYGTQHPEP